MGNRCEALHGLLDFGVPYMENGDGTTPMFHAHLINDQDSVNVIVQHLAEDINQLEMFDTQHMIQNF